MDKVQENVQSNTDTNRLQLYHIFHALNPTYMFTEHEQQPREYVGSVLANGLKDAFIRAQNEYDGDYKRYNVRSTAIGDMIQDTSGFYMVCKNEFRFVCSLDDDRPE